MAIAAAVLGSVGSLAAQGFEAPPAPPPNSFGQLRFGVLSISPTFRISNIGWDTNVFDMSGTERQPGDFTATFDPGFETRLTTGRLRVRALTHATLVYYQTYKSEQAVNPVVELQADDRLSSRLAVYVKGEYGYSKERSGYEIDSRPRAFSQSTTAGIRAGSGKLGLDLHGLYGQVAYDTTARFLNVSLAQSLNERTSGGGALLSYALSPYTTMTAGVDESLHRFPLASERDSNALSTSVGLRFSPRAVISGSAAIGYEQVDALNIRAPNFSGPTGRAGLTYKLHDMFSIGIGAERGLENSFYGDRPYYIFTLYESSARMALFHHFDVGGSLQYTTLAYRYFNDVAAPTAPRDVVRMETVNVGVPLKRQLRVGAFAQRWRRISDERPYETTRVGLEMTVGPLNLSERGIFLSGPAR